MMVGRSLGIARRNLILAGLVLVFMALGLMVVAEFQSFRHQLSAAQQDSRILAQQVRELGGTPKVTPAPGPTGPAGASGQPGASGSSGQNGRNGSNGSPGTAGAKGSAGSPGPAGASGAAGGQGPAGPAGKDGQDGKDGAKGDTGATGPPPSSWSWNDALGVTHTCTQDSPGSTTYTCKP
jgi:hypothetical protein